MKDFISLAISDTLGHMAIEFEKLTSDTLARLSDYYPWPSGFWIRSNFVQTLNSKVTDSSKQLYLASNADKEIFRYLRTTADCLIVGTRTALSEPYQNVKPTAKYLSGKSNSTSTSVAIVSNSLNLPIDFLSNFSNPPLIFTNQYALDQKPDINKWAKVIILGEKSVELANLKPALLELDLKRILCEGGAALQTSLVNADLLDEINLTIANRIGASVESNLFSSEIDQAKQEDFEFTQVLVDNNNLFLRAIKK